MYGDAAVMLGGIGISAWYSATSDTVGDKKEDRSAGRFAAVDGSEASVLRLSMIRSLPASMVLATEHIRKDIAKNDLRCCVCVAFAINAPTSF